MQRSVVSVLVALTVVAVLAFAVEPEPGIGPATDHRQAELMLGLLETVAQGRAPERSAIDELMASPGTDLILAQLNIARAVDGVQYRLMLEGLAEDPGPEIRPLDDGVRARHGVEGLSQIRAVLRWGMTDTAALRATLDWLKDLEVHRRAKERAESFLPSPLAQVPPTFVVMGGRAGAAALEDGLYLDPLLMAFTRHRHGGPPLDEADVVDFFAHEMHHVGAHAAFDERARSLELEAGGALAFRFLAALVAEGSATYLISSHRDLGELRQNPLYAPELAREEELLEGCAGILARLLDSSIADEPGYDEAVASMLGSGFHVAGAILLSAIDRRTGLEAVVSIIDDPRRLAVEANRACDDTATTAARAPFFDPDVAARAASLGGETPSQDRDAS